MKKLASQDEAYEVLSPYFGDIVYVIRAGWQSWLDLPIEKKVDITKRTKASIIHDGITAACRTRFHGRDGITVREERGFIEVGFHNKIVLRFKMFRGRKLRTSGIPTRQRWEWMRQQLSLPGVPDVTVVIAGYRLDSLEQDIDLIALTCPRGLRRNAWTIILEDEAAPAGNVTPLAYPTGPLRTVQVRSARVSDDQTTKEG